MATAVHVPGPCEVKIEASSGSGDITTLGWTRNMADVTREAFWLDVPGDQNGGDDGPPIEVLYLGEIARIRLELTKWDSTIAQMIEKRVQGATLGTPYTTGTMMLSDPTKCLRVLLHTTTEILNFPLCIPRAPIEIGKGTKYSTLVCEFEAHKDSTGVLYNDTAAV